MIDVDENDHAVLPGPAQVGEPVALLRGNPEQVTRGELWLCHAIKCVKFRVERVKYPIYS